MSKPRYTFVVVLPSGHLEWRTFGPYRSLKAAEGDAKAISPRAFVLPLEKPEDAP